MCLADLVVGSFIFVKMSWWEGSDNAVIPSRKSGREGSGMMRWRWILIKAQVNDSVGFKGGHEDIEDPKTNKENSRR